MGSRPINNQLHEAAGSLARSRPCIPSRNPASASLPFLDLACCLSLQCDHFFFLLEGEVQLARGGVVLGTLGEGSFVVSGRELLSTAA